MVVRSLHITVHQARTFGYLLASLMLTQLSLAPLALSFWLVFLMCYPPLLCWFVERSGRDHRAVMASMLVDSVVVGLLVSLTGFHLEGSVVLLTLISVSVLIVGGAKLLGLCVPLLVTGMLSGYLNHGATPVGGTGFYYVCFGALVAYIAFVGLQVFQETRRLKLEKREEKGVRESLEAVSRFCSPFVPPQLLEMMKARLPQRKWLTVLFVDIVNFDELADELPTEQCRRLMHDYVDLVIDVADRKRGTVDKFIGSTAIVFVGDHGSKGVSKDARDGVALALEIRQAFSQLLCQTHQLVVQEPIQLRIGIHTGQCLVGETGGDRRKDYSVLGRSVALTARLKNAAQPGEILMSADTLRHVSAHCEFSRRGGVYRQGGDAIVETFAVDGRVSQSNRAVEVLQRNQHV